MSFPFFLEQDGSLTWISCPWCSTGHQMKVCCCMLEAELVGTKYVCRRRLGCKYVCEESAIDNARRILVMWNERPDMNSMYLLHCGHAFGSTVRLLCEGLTAEKYKPLFFSDLQGTFPATEFGYFSKKTIDNRSYFMTAGYPLLSNLITLIMKAGRLGSIPDIDACVSSIPAAFPLSCWAGYSYCVRSVFCTGTATHNKLCEACFNLDRLQGKYQLARRAENSLLWLQKAQSREEGLARKKHKEMTGTELLALVQRKASEVKHQNRRLDRRDRVVGKRTRTIEDLKNNLSQGVDKRGLVPLLRQAYDTGLLSDTSNIGQMMSGMLEGLLGRARRRYSVAEKSFYAAILSYGGPLLHDFVSKNLFGPNIRTSRNERNHGFDVQIGICRENVTQAVSLLKKYNLCSVPYALSEDGSHCQARLDPVLAEGKVMIYGLCGGVYEIRSMQDLWDICDKYKLAYSFYVYTLIPLVEDAPYLPIAVYPNDLSNETFSRQQMASNIDTLCQWLKEEGIDVVLNVGDGASTYRSLAMERCLKPKACIQCTAERKCYKCTNAVSIDHPLIELYLPPTSMSESTQVEVTDAFPDVSLADVRGMTIDYVHITWRGRQQAIDPKRRLFVGGLLHNTSYLRQVQKENKANPMPDLEGFRIYYKDLDPSDKQAMDSTLRLFDIGTGESETKVPVYQMRRAMDLQPEYYGTRLVLEFWHRYTSLFVVKNMDVRNVIINCGFCISFLGYWRKSIVNHTIQDLSITSNFITAQTRQDVIISCNMIVLLVKFMRLWCQKKNVDLPLSAGRVSSRFSEYVFQFLRCSNKTSSKFSVLSGKHLLKLCMSTLRIEREAGWVFPPFKRGERERGKAHDTPVQYLFVESATIGDSEIKSMLDLGMEQAKQMLKKKVGGYSVWDDVIGKSPSNVDKVLLLEEVNLSPRTGRTAETLSASMLPPRPPKQPRLISNTADTAITRRSSRLRNMAGREAELEADDSVVPHVNARPSLRMLQSVMESTKESDKRVSEEEVQSEASYDSETSSTADSDEELVGEADVDKELSGIQRRKSSLQRREDGLLNRQICLVMDKIKQANLAETTVEKRRLLQEALDVCRMINSCIHKQDNSRTRGRFFEPAIMDAALVVDPHDRISDCDHVGVFTQNPALSRGYGCEPAVVELLLRENHKGKLLNVTQLNASDESGRLVIRYFEPVIERDSSGKSRQKRVDGMLAYRLPIISNYDSLNSAITLESFITTLQLIYHKETDLYLLERRDEIAFKKYKNRELNPDEVVETSEDSVDSNDGQEVSGRELWLLFIEALRRRILSKIADSSDIPATPVLVPTTIPPSEVVPDFEDQAMTEYGNALCTTKVQHGKNNNEDEGTLEEAFINVKPSRTPVKADRNKLDALTRNKKTLKAHNLSAKTVRLGKAAAAKVTAIEKRLEKRRQILGPIKERLLTENSVAERS